MFLLTNVLSVVIIFNISSMPLWQHMHTWWRFDLGDICMVDKDLKREDGTVDNAHFYGFVLIMKRLLTTEDFSSMKDELIKTTMKYPSVNRKYYGFRDDWQNQI